MAKENVESNLYNTKSDVEKHLKSDKSFMANRSAAEFDAFVEGAMFIINDKAPYIAKLKDRLKAYQNKVAQLNSELAPYRELYEDYEMVPKRMKKTKTKIADIRNMENEEELMGIVEGDDFGYTPDDDFQE